MTDNGTIQTGKAHPHRESISHPYAPVPNTSNVDKDASENLNRGKSVSPERKSLLHEKADIEHKSSTENEQGEAISYVEE